MKETMRLAIPVVFLVSVFASSVDADDRLLTSIAGDSLSTSGDWPQWRGPDRNGISNEKDGEWVLPPALVWKREIDAQGYGGIAVSGDRVYTAGQPDKADLIVLCLDAETGSEVWRYRSEVEHSVNSTPTVDNGSVYVYSTKAHLIALDADTGEQKWGTDIGAAIGGRAAKSGDSGSPLVLGDLLILNAGSHGVAVHRKTGEVAWKSPVGPSGHGSPVTCMLTERPTVLVFSYSGLNAVDAMTGVKRWSFPWSPKTFNNNIDPVVYNNRVLIWNKDRGAVVLEMSGDRARRICELDGSPRAGVHTPLLLNDVLYWPHANKLTCIDFLTGQVRWKVPVRGIAGQTFFMDGVLITVSDYAGKLVLAQLQQSGCREIATVQMFMGQSFNAAALAGGCLYARNQMGDIACYRIYRPSE